MKKIVLILFISLVNIAVCIAQDQAYTIKKVSFSTDWSDEFSPVYFKQGLVFCTDRDRGITVYSSDQNEGFLNIYYVAKSPKGKWQKSKLLSKKLKSKLNDGPSSFSKGGDTIYFSANLTAFNKVGDANLKNDKLGIFYSVQQKKKWSDVQDFAYNNEWYNVGYNVTTPCLSPDGKRIYFASDMPGGFGGSDIYYCQKMGKGWLNPTNLGSSINTSGNEAYPFINAFGELIFSSDGHPGYGGKDIFLSRYDGINWLTPVAFSPPINTEFNDFALVSDRLMDQGYFSSDRDKSVDIYEFKTEYGQIFYSDPQRELELCLLLSDSGSIQIDDYLLEYEWNFGDGQKATGKEVHHCYKTPGIYHIKLDLIDKASRIVYFTKLEVSCDIKNLIIPYISSPDFSVTDSTIYFDASQSRLPGFKALKYCWDFGDGHKSQGEYVNHFFTKPGTYIVKLNLVLESDSSMTLVNKGVTKEVIVSDAESSFIEQVNNKKQFVMVRSDSIHSSICQIQETFSAENELMRNGVFEVELFSSKIGTDEPEPDFSKIPGKYSINKELNQKDSTHKYYIARDVNIMSVYNAFFDARKAGFTNAIIKMVTITDPAEIDLFNLEKIYSKNTDLFFDEPNRLTATAYGLLNDIVKLMYKYSNIKLIIEVHSDDTGNNQKSLALTKRRAQLLVNYLVNRGINSDRVIGYGYGGERHVVPDTTHEGRILNRRLEFKILR